MIPAIGVVAQVLQRQQVSSHGDSSPISAGEKKHFACCKMSESPESNKDRLAEKPILLIGLSPRKTSGLLTFQRVCTPLINDTDEWRCSGSVGPQ